MKQILVNTSKVIAFCLLLATTAACNEDLGNYDYTEINSVKIGEKYNDKGVLEEGIGSRYVEAGDSLIINPILEFSKGNDEGIFTYAWYYWASGEWNLLQEGRNLAVEVAAPIGTPDKIYSLAFEAINTKTNIPYRKTFAIGVINVLTKGFLALCEYEDGFDIDQIALSANDRFQLHKSVLEMVESDLPRQGVKPRDILCFHDDMAPHPYRPGSEKYSVCILTDQYTTRILPGDYSWDPSYDISNTVEANSYLDKEYVQKGKPIICEKMKVMYKSGNYFPLSMIYVKDSDGKSNWYVCTRHPMWLFYSNPMNSLRPNGDSRFEPAPFNALSRFGALYFDVDEKKFMFEGLPNSQQGSQYVFYSDPLPATEPDGGVFNFSDPNEGLLYMGEQDGTGGTPWSTLLYAILKQADGTFKYIEFGDVNSAGNMVAAANKKRVSSFPANSNIGNAKFFARAPYANTPFLYYATGDNKVYKADISSATAAVEEITSSILINDGYSEITAFKYTLPNSDVISSGRSLAVATYNSSLGKNAGGKLEFFRIENSATGNLTLAKYPETVNDGEYQIDMSWKDLGKIVGLTYKQK